MQTHLIDQRAILAQEWLQSLAYKHQLHSLITDASFRRYWFLQEDGTQFDKVHPVSDLLLMDCPPDKESLSSFINTADILAKNPLWKIPIIHAKNEKQGFALIENFGDHLFSKAYQQHPERSKSYIDFALKALVGLQKHGVSSALPDYDESQLQTEMDLFTPWFAEKLCQYKLSEIEEKTLKYCQQILIENMLAQPQVIVHRDYHCRNLLLTSASNELVIDNYSLGVIDFQDAVNGAITYDAVSILKDCYWRLETQEQIELLHQYWQYLCNEIKVIPNWKDFQRDFHYSGIQRHLKVLGIFSRLAIHYKKPQYLNNIPLVLSHLMTALELHDHFSELTTIIKKLAQRVENLQIK